MILELDVGNTRVKWRVIDSAGLVMDAGAVNTVQQLRDTVEAQVLDRVRIACVRPGDLLDGLTGMLRSEWGVVPELAQVQRECGGVTVAYRDLRRLGVDRWLTLLAARSNAAGGAVIVDCGTAMTVDLLAASGQHLGGYIVPGLRLGPLALTEHTAIRLQGEPHWALEPGMSTEDAIYHGAMLMLTSFLDTALVRELPRLSGMQQPVLYLTGGDAPLLREFLARRQDIEIRESAGLVFEGLGIALP